MKQKNMKFQGNFFGYVYTYFAEMPARHFAFATGFLFGVCLALSAAIGIAML